MATEGSLAKSMDIAVGHYSSLFKLPPYTRMVSLQALICMGGALVSIVVLFPSLNGLMNGLVFGISLFAANLLVDQIISKAILDGDPIYDLRRTTGLSLFTWVFWVFFNFVGVIVALPFGFSWWVRLFLLGFSAAMIFRSTVLGSTSSMGWGRLLIASLLQPFACIVPFLVMWVGVDYFMVFFLIISPIVGIVASSLFIFLLDRTGKETLGVSAMSLLKAFLLNWVVDLNAPLEVFLERLGESHDVEVSLIKFDSSKPKAIILVPSVHPGPFKNIGSSPLPSILKTALERESKCVVGVPHGLLGHEFDLASQLQNRKVVNCAVELANLAPLEAKATPFLKVSNGLGTACCQIFGNSAFMSFSLAPKTTEDLPHDLGLFVRQEAEKRGLSCYVVVNAHNSIGETVKPDEALASLKAVAADCLEKTVSLKQSSFEVGAATVLPKEFTLRDGMGPGGITVVVVRVREQKTAYVVIDGNNMVAGLREKVLSALSSVGVDEGEVFTTDTHVVNAVVLVERGYHPVGENMGHEKLIEYVKKATLDALSNLEHAKASCHKMTVPDVKVIGEESLQKLCLLIDTNLKRAKRIVVPIFASSGLLLMLFLMFL